MQEKRPSAIELFYTLTCPSCKEMKRMLDEVLPKYGSNFTFKKTLANGPVGYIRTMKLGVHAVPTLLIGNKIVFRSVPAKSELIEKLDQFLKN